MSIGLVMLPSVEAISTASSEVLSQVSEAAVKSFEMAMSSSSEGGSSAVEALGGGSSSVEAVAEVDPVSAQAAAGIEGAGSEATLGERILSSIQGVSDRVQAGYKSVIGAPYELNTADIRDLMLMQAKMMRFSVDVEMMGKVVSKGVQGVEQLVKIS